MSLNRRQLIESSLSRVQSHIENFDIACISACRYRDCNCEDYACDHHILTKDENKQRTASLKAKLLSLRYGVTAISGNYIEGFGTGEEKEVKEDTFLVVNLNDDSDFENQLLKLGKEYCQDSVLIKLKEKDGYLVGTNKCDFPGFGNQHPVGQFHGGKTAEFLSRVNGRPFTFEHFELQSNNSKRIITEIAARPYRAV